MGPGEENSSKKYAAKELVRGYAEGADSAEVKDSYMGLLYKDQTDKLIGAMIKVYNSLGYGYREKEYQNAYAEELKSLDIKFSRELYSVLKYKDRVIRKYFLDFLTEFDSIKIVVELKVANEVYKQHFTQALQYLTNNNFKLGLILVITPRQVVIKRVINEISAPSAKSAYPREN